MLSVKRVIFRGYLETPTTSDRLACRHWIVAGAHRTKKHELANSVSGAYGSRKIARRPVPPQDTRVSKAAPQLTLKILLYDWYTYSELNVPFRPTIAEMPPVSNAPEVAGEKKPGFPESRHWSQRIDVARKVAPGGMNTLLLHLVAL